jgi:hypothetical protein
LAKLLVTRPYYILMTWVNFDLPHMRFRIFLVFVLLTAVLFSSPCAFPPPSPAEKEKEDRQNRLNRIEEILKAQGHWQKHE